MNFVQPEYVAFLTIVFALYWALPTTRLQNVLLVVASAIFYGWVHPWFVVLMYGSAILDFSLAQAIERFPKRKRALVGLSLALNLTFLAYFKYFDFFVENVVGALQLAGVQTDLRTVGILLPVGISFYTFQTIGYILDVARGELKAHRDFVEYVLYISFFAQLVAGPIERAGRLLPQIASDRRFSIDAVRSGIALAMWGGFKKVVVADSIAPYVDKVYILEDPAGPLLWVATAGFMLQIYADFSGYTDIARGSARLLGFDLTENFRAPFLAKTTIEFWQRYHMSLSFWIRDYILGPLLGDAQGATSRVRFVFATITTFLIVGLWHGASWNFALFGLYHGIWVVGYGTLARRIPDRLAALPGAGAAAVVFHLVAVGLVGSMLFRERHVDRIVHHLTTNPFSARADEWVATIVLGAIVVAGAVPLLLGYAFDQRVRPKVEGTVWHLPLQTTAWAAYAFAMFVFYRMTAQDFVYFQF